MFQLAHPELRADFPPLKSLSNLRPNLPGQLTTFVGRERERAAQTPDDRSLERARALWALSMILSWKGETASARALAEQSVKLWRESGNALELPWPWKASAGRSSWRTITTGRWQRWKIALKATGNLVRRN